MRIWALLALGLLHITTPALAQSNQQLLDTGIALFQDGLYEEALPPLEQTYRQQPDAQSARWLGLTYYQLGDQARAEPLLRTAGNNPQARYALTEILLNAERLDEALSEARQLQSLDPSPRTQYLLGRVLAARGERAGAIAALEAALATDDPRRFQLTALELIPLYLEVGRNRDAATVASQGVDRDPESFLALDLQNYAVALTETTPQVDRPFQISLGYRFEYDDNVYLEPDDRDLLGDDQQEDPEDFRHTFYGDLLGRHALGHGVEIFGEVHLRGGLHHDLDEFDHLEQSYVASLGWSGKRFGARLPVEFGLIDRDSDRVVETLSVSPGLYFYPRDDLLLYGYYRMQDNDFDEEVDPSEDRSGDRSTFGLLARWQFPDQRGFLRGIIEFGDDDTDGRNWQSDFFRGYLYGEYQITDQLSAGAGFEYLDTDFDKIHDQFFVQREDELLSLFATLRYRIDPHWQIHFQALMADSDSNLGIYQYERNVFSLGLSWQF